MSVLSFQAVQFPALDHRSLPRRRSSTGYINIVRCGIAEPSGEPAPFGQKTRYNDGFFEKVFMTLFARKMGRFAAPAKSGIEAEKKRSWWDCDYERFVDVSKRVMQGRSRMQQQEVVREVLLSMLPPGAPDQVGFSHFPCTGCLGFLPVVHLYLPICSITHHFLDGSMSSNHKVYTYLIVVAAVQETLSTDEVGCRVQCCVHSAFLRLVGWAFWGKYATNVTDQWSCMVI